jgi:nitrogen fixation protein FixH
MKLNWSSGIAITYILFAAIMILFAVKASQQKNDLVVDNYYDEAVKYQKQIDASHNNDIAKNQLNIEYLSDQKIITLNYTDHQKALDGEISFYKPDGAEKDFKLQLNLDKEGKQIISTTQLAKGVWDLKCSWKVDGTYCYKELRIIIQ